MAERAPPLQATWQHDVQQQFATVDKDDASASAVYQKNAPADNGAPTVSSGRIFRYSPLLRLRPLLASHLTGIMLFCVLHRC